MFGCLGLGSAVEESKSKSLRFSSFLFGVPFKKSPKRKGEQKHHLDLSPQPREKKKRHATIFQLSRFETYGKPYPIFPPGRPQPKAPGYVLSVVLAGQGGWRLVAYDVLNSMRKTTSRCFFWGMAREIALDEAKLLSHKISRDRIPEI